MNLLVALSCKTKNIVKPGMHPAMRLDALRDKVIPLFEEEGLSLLFESVTHGPEYDESLVSGLATIIYRTLVNAQDERIVTRTIAETPSGYRVEYYDIHDDARAFFEELLRCGWNISFVFECTGDLYLDCSSITGDGVVMTCCLRKLSIPCKRFIVNASNEVAKGLFWDRAEGMALSEGHER